MQNIQFQKNYSALINPSALPLQQPRTEKAGGGKTSFSQVLQNTLQKGDLTFSKHALQRMSARQIEVSPHLVSRMNSAVEKARSKGVREALILNGETAFIVNVPNSTVVTTMNGGEMKENVFTNIDGAVIL